MKRARDIRDQLVGECIWLLHMDNFTTAHKHTYGILPYPRWTCPGASHVLAYDKCIRGDHAALQAAYLLLKHTVSQWPTPTEA